MVEKVKALCDAIDTLNSLPTNEYTDARLAELSEMLLAECRNMTERPVKQVAPPVVQVPQPYSERFYVAGTDIEIGDPVVFVGDRVYSTRKHPFMRPYDKDIDNPLTPPR